MHWKLSHFRVPPLRHCMTPPLREWRSYLHSLKLIYWLTNVNKTQEKGPHFREAPEFLGICLCYKLLSSDYASHLTNLV